MLLKHTERSKKVFKKLLTNRNTYDNISELLLKQQQRNTKNIEN